MFYGPTSERYWDEMYRVVAINMEPYGYNDAGLFHVNRDELIRWIYDAGKTKTKTTRYTLCFLSGLLAHLNNNSIIDNNYFRRAYANSEIIEDILDRTVYYNIRPQSNIHKPQDYSAIASVGDSEYGPMIWEEIQALEPHLVFISGHAGLDALNAILKLPRSVRFCEGVFHDRIYIQSIPHPSRPSYSYWKQVVETCKQVPLKA